MSLEITELDTVSYPSWWSTSNTVRIRESTGSGSQTIIFEGATSDVEFLPQGVAYPYAVVPWSNVSSIVGTS